MPKKVVRSFPTMDVVAAACAAQRVNGEYVKVQFMVGDTEWRKTNRELVHKFLDDQSVIMDSDRQLAENIKQFYKGYTFKLLSGDYISQFDRNILIMLEEENCIESSYNIAVLASLPNSYIRAKQRHEADSRIRTSQGGYVGTVKERINLKVEVLKCNFSQKWNVFFITAITTNDEPLFFSYKEELPVGKVLSIVGTVKRQDNNQTQLNRVKVL